MQNSINERITAFLKANNTTISKVAEMIGTSQGTLSNKLNGRYRIDVDTLTSLLTLFPELSADYILLGQGPMMRTRDYHNETMNWQINENGDNFAGFGNTINRDGVRIIELLEKQLEEEKTRSKEYWNTIQKLINKQ